MKNLTILFLVLCSYAVQAQITSYNNAAQNTFYGIGGYSFSQFTFPDGVQATPYVISGPSPQNDFSYVITTIGGAINNSAGVITTVNSNTNILIEMKGNNVRKFACNVYAHVNDVTTPVSNIITLTATTNLGNFTTQTVNIAVQFVGFNVTGNENEYIVSVLAQVNNTPSPTARIALYGIMVGDNIPQNVALHFDGINNYVALPSTVGNFATNQDFTVSCWIKPATTQVPQGSPVTDENDIISEWNGSSGAGNGYPFVIRYINTTNTIRVGQYDGSGVVYVNSSTALNDGQWHYVAFVREGGAGSDVFKFYRIHHIATDS
jgi:hypothetical protein